MERSIQTDKFRKVALCITAAVWLLCCRGLHIERLAAQSRLPAPGTFHNPILTGFNPDPSICRVGTVYYLVTSSFNWYPGIPIYHSKDLVNWQLIGHAINRPGMVDLGGLGDNNGIWAVTIRHHNGLFYLITSCSQGGGNFYMTAKDPRGPWSDPVWLKDADGVDPSLFWDTDGRCFYIGNQWGGFKKSWDHQTAIWMQELDLKRGKLVGERKILTYGFAANAAYAEAPHLYKIDGRYLLMTAEGGTDDHHAVTVFHSDAIQGPYKPDMINPVLSHRQLGKDYPLQAVGHADLVQTQNAEWFAVCLGKRMIAGVYPLARETFLCRVEFEHGTPIFNPGFGRVLLGEQQRPRLPWTPVPAYPGRDDFDGEERINTWYAPGNERSIQEFEASGWCRLPLSSASVDSLKSRMLFLKKVKDFSYTATTKLRFKPKSHHEQAGIVMYRTVNGYYSLVKTRDRLLLIRKDKGIRNVVAEVPYNRDDVILSVKVDANTMQFSFGETPAHLSPIGGWQPIDAIADNQFNRFNGVGIGIYASANGHKTTGTADFDWFIYRPEKDAAGQDKERSRW